MVTLNAIMHADSELVGRLDKYPSSSTMRIKVEGNQRVGIQLPGNGSLWFHNSYTSTALILKYFMDLLCLWADKDELSMVSLNEISTSAECSDQELSGFVSSLFFPSHQILHFCKLNIWLFWFVVIRRPGWVDHMLKIHPNQWMGSYSFPSLLVVLWDFICQRFLLF